MPDFSSWRDEYLVKRQTLLDDGGAYITQLEQGFMEAIVKAVLKVVPEIEKEFKAAPDYLPFWLNYAPRQRGRAPVGDAVPWGEVGEKLILATLAEGVAQQYPGVRYPALPFGGDFRFATDQVLLHLDVKMTGPRDNPDEIVASPNQVSGDGYDWNEKGVLNHQEQIIGPRATRMFQPELPPLYFSHINKDSLQVCLTYFIKAVYSVSGYGDQPLNSMEVVCVPNGLLMFDGPRYRTAQGLLIPGKDELTHAHPRTRIRLQPLADLHSWRCVKLQRNAEGQWYAQERPAGQTSSPVLPLLK